MTAQEGAEVPVLIHPAADVRMEEEALGNFKEGDF